LSDYLSDYRLDEQVIWAPQPGPQEALVHCPITLIGYGGARGGGKTDGVLGKFAVKQELLGPDFNAIFFRKELPQADDLIERAKQIYLPLKAHWQDQKKQFTFQNGARLRFRPLADDSDAEKYQGQNLSDCAIEEAGNYADPAPIWKLFGALRGKGGGQIILTFNPGGIGHGWLKELFIRPAPKGMKILRKDLPNGAGFDYIYIPSRVHDNQILLAKDPEYINRLHMVGSPELVRAWLEGDFEIHEGSYFPEFSSKHIVSPFNVPKHWPRYLGFDWGFRSPFAAVWGAVSSGQDDKGNEVPYPKGSIIIYREMWGKGVDNVEQANRIGAASVGENLVAVADPSIFKHDGGPSINDQFTQVFAKYKHPSFKAGDNDRLSGWSQIRQRLVNKPPLLYIFATCPYLIQTLPALAIDKRKPEDADSGGDDHVCFSGDTLVVTDSGPLPIKDLCNKTSVMVLSHDGQYHRACGLKTKENASVIKLNFDDGSSVTCTPMHLFLTNDNEWKPARFLTSEDVIRCVTYESKRYQPNVSGVQRHQVLSLWSLFQCAKKAISRLKTIAQSCMGILLWGNTKRNAHPSQEWRQDRQSNRKPSVAGFKSAFDRAYDTGTTSTGTTKYIVKSHTYGDAMAQISSGQGMAFGTCQVGNGFYAVNRTKMSFLWSDVSNEVAHEMEIQVLPPKLQNERKTKKVKSISYGQAPQDVYCLNVPDTSTFVLANGAVVHNCDALRYLCKERLIDSKWQQPAEVFNKGIIKLQAYISQVRRDASRPKI